MDEVSITVNQNKFSSYPRFPTYEPVVNLQTDMVKIARRRNLPIEINYYYRFIYFYVNLGMRRKES